MVSHTHHPSLKEKKIETKQIVRSKFKELTIDDNNIEYPVNENEEMREGNKILTRHDQ